MEAIALIDPAGSVLELNSAARALLGGAIGREALGVKPADTPDERGPQIRVRIVVPEDLRDRDVVLRIPAVERRALIREHVRGELEDRPEARAEVHELRVQEPVDRPEADLEIQARITDDGARGRRSGERRGKC